MRLRASDFFIVTVPTPIDEARRPDLGAMFEASRLVGAALKKGDIVVYESTVYPGAVEEECVPILEQMFGSEGRGRISTSDIRRSASIPATSSIVFESITKVVSAQNAETLDIVAETSTDRWSRPAFIAHRRSRSPRRPR